MATLVTNGRTQNMSSTPGCEGRGDGPDHPNRPIQFSTHIMNVIQSKNVMSYNLGPNCCLISGAMFFYAPGFRAVFGFQSLLTQATAISTISSRPSFLSLWCGVQAITDFSDRCVFVVVFMLGGCNKMRQYCNCRLLGIFSVPMVVHSVAELGSSTWLTSRRTTILSLCCGM